MDVGWISEVGCYIIYIYMADEMQLTLFVVIKKKIIMKSK